MKNHQILTTLLLPIILLFLSCGGGDELSDINPGFDFTGIDQFLNIADKLQKDQEPTPKEWDDMFKTQGYNIIRLNEISAFFFERSFRYVFMPSMSDSLTWLMEKSNTIKKRLLRHYIEVRDRYPEVKAQTNLLKKSPIAQNAAMNALSFLPMDELTDYPPVSFLIFDDGVRNLPIICIDVLHSKKMGDELPKMLAREYFMRMRGTLMQFDPSDVRAEDQPLIRSLENMLSGGTADYIYKREVLLKQPYDSLSQMDQVYMDMYNSAPEVIGTMNKFLELMMDDQSHYAGYTSQFKKALPMDGNPIGFYMVEVIDKVAGKGSLIRQIANPFAFLTIYNSAAKLRPGEYPVFSDNSLSVTKILEGKYLK